MNALDQRTIVEHQMSDDLFEPTKDDAFDFGAPALYSSSVLICDIRGFTHLLQDSNPKEAFLFIEEFLFGLTSAVLDEGGTVNNLTGDGFLAQFGIGLAKSNHALHAVNSAIVMRERLKQINQKRHMVKNATFNVGIGIHSGLIAGGHVRLGTNSSFLIIGDTINVASRIEELTKQFAVDILISESTAELVMNQVQLLKMPSRAVKGKSEKLHTFWLPPHAKVVKSF